MTEKEIFDYLFKIAKTSKDQEGVVAACLVKDGQSLAGSPSADDSIRHAEFSLCFSFPVLGRRD